MKTILFVIALVISISTYCQCPDMQTETDKFTGDKTVNFKYRMGDVMMISKYIKGGDTLFSLYLIARAHSPSYDAKGLYFIYQDSTKESFPDVKVNARYSGESIAPYTYTGSKYFTKDEMEILANNFITNYRLYIYDIEIKKKAIEKYKAQCKCLLSAK